MAAAIILPDLGASPVKLSLWLVAVGEPVFEGDSLVEVLVGGATFEVASPATGRLNRKNAWPEDFLQPGQVLGAVAKEG